MVYIEAGDRTFRFIGTLEVYSSRRDAYTKAARLVRPCKVCGAEFEITAMIPGRTRDRAEELLANPPRGIRGGPYPRTWTGRPPEKDVTLRVPMTSRLGTVTCPEHRGQANRRRRPLTLEEQIAELV